MGFFDLLFLILYNLGRRKARVALTAIGVVIGTAAVVILVSLAFGLQRNATSQLYGIGDLTLIQVYPNWGEPTTPNGPPGEQKMITDDSMAEIQAIPGVKAAIARD